MVPTGSYLPAKLVILIIALLAGLYVYSLWGRIPDIDDAWIGELAYFLAEEGQMRSELMRGITLQEDKFVVNNKLFTLLGALFIKVFGFSLYALKSVSLIWFLGFLLLFYAYTMKWKRLFGRDEFLASLLIIFSFTYLFKYSFLYRPEVMMMTIGFGAFIMLEKYLEKNKPAFLFFAGLLFGITVATHLNGLILSLSAGSLLIWNKRYIAIVTLFAGFLAGCLPFFYDMTSPADYTLWYHQFFGSPALDSLAGGPLWMKPLFNLMREYLRYFFKIEIAVYSVLIVAALVFGIKYLMQRHRQITLFALFNIFFTALIAMHKSQQYLLLNFPYILIMLLLVFQALVRGNSGHFWVFSRKFMTITLAFLFAVFFVSSVYHNVLLAKQKFSPQQHREMTMTYAGDNPGELNIIAPMTFIFNEIEHFNRIQGEVCYVEFSKADPSVYGEGFIARAAYYDIDLIMISPYYSKILGLSGYNRGDAVGNYLVVDKTENLLVWKAYR